MTSTPETLRYLMNCMVGAATRHDVETVKKYAFEGDAHAAAWQASEQARQRAEKEIEYLLGRAAYWMEATR